MEEEVKELHITSIHTLSNDQKQELINAANSDRFINEFSVFLNNEYIGGHPQRH